MTTSPNRPLRVGLEDTLHLHSPEAISVPEQALHPGRATYPASRQAESTCIATPRARDDLHRPAAAAETLRCALASSQQDLVTALGRIDALTGREWRLRQEIVALEQTLEQARQFAYHDELTGLPNRRLLLDRYNQAVARAARQHKQVALLFLDLDHFKSINDAFGHVVGDRILQQAAARLIAGIRTSDTVCRFGGDEFVILLPDFEGQERAVAVEQKIRAHLATPYVIDGIAISVTASIGIAVYPVDGHEYGNLIQVSDLAMYRSKARSLARPGIFEPARPTCGQPDSTDSAEEYSHATKFAETTPIGDELRSRAGRSVQ